MSRERISITTVNEKELNAIPTRTLGSFLRERRRREGFSIRKLVDVIQSMSLPEGDVSLSPAYICDIENGKRTPSDGVLFSIAKALRISDKELEPYDNRVPSHEIQKLAQTNALFGVAFRRMVKHIRQNDVSAEEFLKSMMNQITKSENA